MRALVVAIGIVLASVEEGHTSSFGSWEKSLPGMCIAVDIQVGAHGDGGATENRIIRETKAALDSVAAKIAAPLQARLARFIATRSPLAKMVAATETAPCLDEANAGNPKHPAYADAPRWSAPMALDTLAAMLGNSGPSFAGVTDWRGISVRIRLAQRLAEPLRVKLANELIVAQFRGGPTPVADPSLSLSWVEGSDFTDAPRRLFAALAVVARDRRAAAASSSAIVATLLAALDDKPLPARAAEAPHQLLLALWTLRDTQQMASWIARLEHLFVDGRGDEIKAYFDAAGIPLPPLPGAKLRAKFVAVKNPGDYDDVLRDLMKPHHAVANEDAMLREIWNTWRASKTRNDYQSVIRVLLQLTFAQRRIVIADALFVETARLSTKPPTGYTPISLLREVFDHVWRMKQPLLPSTINALADEASKLDDEVAQAAIRSLVNVPWSVPDRVALVTRLSSCASCKPDAAKSIREATEAERNARNAP